MNQHLSEFFGLMIDSYLKYAEEEEGFDICTFTDGKMLADRIAKLFGEHFNNEIEFGGVVDGKALSLRATDVRWEDDGVFVQLEGESLDLEEDDE